VCRCQHFSGDIVCVRILCYWCLQLPKSRPIQQSEQGVRGRVLDGPRQQFTGQPDDLIRLLQSRELHRRVLQIRRSDVGLDLHRRVLRAQRRPRVQSRELCQSRPQQHLREQVPEQSCWQWSSSSQTSQWPANFQSCRRDLPPNAWHEPRPVWWHGQRLQSCICRRVLQWSVQHGTCVY